MIVAACMGLAFFVLFLVVRLCNRLDLINEEVEDWIAETRELKQRCDGHKELIEALSRSVRELNGVVEAAVKVKEETSDNKPDTKALISGWDADEPEPIQQHISKEEWSMQLVQAILNCQRIEPLPQQCILPLQQTPFGTILPLRCMNRRLEDM